MYRRIIGSINLMFSHIHLVHVHQGNCIPVLVVIESDTNLVKEELYVKARCVLINPVVDNDLFMPLSSLNANEQEFNLLGLLPKPV